jgi:Uncharacterised nucleotidyltransferase
MTRWEAFETVCAYLRAGLLGGAPVLPAEVTWELIVEVASFHYATTTLATCIKPTGDVPGDVRDYFESALALNEKRNEQMLSTLARVAGLLNAIDIEPLLLKGSALLVEGIYPQPSMRIMGDIDILIPGDRATEACDALKAAGFDTKWSAVSPPTHHHLPMLLDPITGTGVELHTDVISRDTDAVIATDWFCEMARPATFRGQRVRLPEPTRNAGHIIFHGEIFHELYALNKVQLRHVIDLALLRACHETAIDWDELDRRFSAAGAGEVLATYLHLISELLGLAAPRLSHAPRRDALAELRNTESRDGFHFQIERLQVTCDRLLTHSSFLQSELDNARSARDGFRDEIERMQSARDSLSTHSSLLQSELEHARSALAAISTSRSWRLTAPLRGIANTSRTLWRGLFRQER